MKCCRSYVTFSTWLLVLLAVLLAIADRQKVASSALSESVDGDDLEPENEQLYSLEGDSDMTAPRTSALSGRRDRLKKLLLLALIKQAQDERQQKAMEELEQAGPGYEPEEAEEDETLEAEKRGRWQGFCFRRTRSGRILPYICWKGSDF